jgi:DNA polymerase III delta prime subunit
MSAGDFLCQDAATPMCEFYAAAGAVCSLSTNCETLLEAARESFLPIEDPLGAVDFSVRFWVDYSNSVLPAWPKPYVRGLNHLVFAGFDSGSSMLADLRTRRVIGRFSPGRAADTAHWKTVIFPMLLTIVGASAGIAELHCACVAKDEEGLLLAGPSGSGKSTLALALSKTGFGFLSDDRTFCSRGNGEVLAWGLPTRLKLRHEAAQWFRELPNLQPTETQEGSPDLWLDPESSLGLKRVRRCRPRAIIFLERQKASEFRLSRVSSAEALKRLNKDLMAELPDAVAKRSGTIDKLVDLPCWLLQYDGYPQAIAQQISQNLARLCLIDDPGNRSMQITPSQGHSDMKHIVDIMPFEGVAGSRGAVSMSESALAEQYQEDPLRRLTPTPYHAALPVMGRTVRLETNSSKILEHIVGLFAPYPGSANGHPDFLWKIVSQSDVQMTPPWPKRSAFSGHGLRFAEFGQRNFLAVDIQAREAIAFLAQSLVEDELGFTSPFLDNLFCMTTGSLGLASLRANCVALGNKGILVFGAHNSGKTTACYIAAKLGLDFHADEGVFAEVEGGRLRVWGGFWPAAFRPETLQFLPELQSCTRPFSYRDFTFHHLSKQQFRATQVQSVSPVCCVFLDRQVSAIPRLSHIDHVELSRLLADNVLFKDDDRFEKPRASVLAVLEALPGYHLAYDSNPAVAATFLRQILPDCDMAEEHSEGRCNKSLLEIRTQMGSSVGGSSQQEPVKI